MRASYVWLRELLNFPYAPRELAAIFTRQGMTVDALEHFGRPYDQVVVGELLEVQRHPNADTLTVCKVNVGAETLQIVCGAPGIKAGQRVPVALPGARLGTLDIRKAKLRGVESCGMCCAPDELGISASHDTLLFLDPAVAVGTPFETLVNGEDWLFELDVPNNRPDLLNHVGIAREIAAHMALDGEVKPYVPPAITLAEADEDAADRVTVTIGDLDLCPRYTARVIRAAAHGQSPPWMQARLHRLGMRPLGIIVDITNYVLLEYGHPLHAFDYEKIEGGAIIVRRARQGERMVTLDGTERELDAEMLVIADPAHAVALAGVMGGRETEVTDATQVILLESALFSGPCIRRTAKLLDLRSEASCRFERGVRGMAAEASARAAQLMTQLAGGSVLRGMVDTGGDPAPLHMDVDLARCNSRLGLDVPRQKAKKILGSLGFGVHESGIRVQGSGFRIQGSGCGAFASLPRVQDETAHKDQDSGTIPASISNQQSPISNDAPSSIQHPGSSIVLTVPPHRVDIAEDPDIAEELARVLGYDAVPTDTSIAFRSEVPLPRAVRCREELRDILAGMGLFEAYNPSLVSPELYAAAGVPPDAPAMQFVRLANASTQDQSVLRTLLFPSLVRNVQHNLSFGAEHVRLFELGKVYAPSVTGSTETERLGIVLWGAAVADGIWARCREVDFNDGASVVETLCAKLGIDGVRREPCMRPPGHPGRTARLCVAGEGGIMELGWLAELDPRVLRTLDVRGRLVVAELNIGTLAELWRTDKPYRRLPRFPAATRDVACVVAQTVSHRNMLDAIWAAAVPDTRSVRLFDLYQGDQVPAGCKSMAYHIEYRADDRTLTDDEVNAAHAKIVAALAANVGAQVR